MFSLRYKAAVKADPLCYEVCVTIAVVNFSYFGGEDVSFYLCSVSVYLLFPLL